MKHAIAGVGFAAVTVTAAVAALGSPGSEDAAIAVPAPITSVAPAASQPTPSEIDAALAAEQAARTDRETRDAQRVKLSAAATQQATKRAASLGSEGQSIKAQQAKITSQRAKAKAAAEEKAAKAEAAKVKAAAEAAAARELVRKNRGYEPGTKDPRDIAKQILKNKYGYGDNQYSCFNYIIMRESMWKVNATNPSSGAYGIPQALPGSKMASAGSDWRTNPATQIIWGIDYMKSRYGSPCEAKVFKASHGWY